MVIQKILVLGAGSAGLLAAISLKKKLPQLEVRIVRSPELGTIGVGEGTTPNFPTHIFDYLGIDPARFYKRAEPTWKLGIRFEWGPRQHFDYTFSKQLDSMRSDLPLPNGFFCDDEFRCADIRSALMAYDRAFPRNPTGGGPLIQGYGFHIENRKLIETLEIEAMECGVQIIDGTMVEVERGPQGVSGLLLKDGRKLKADFYIDASGFRSELIGRAFEEPFISFDSALFCDRAVVGGWERTVEPILPYTTAETMDCGWAWKIEHEHHINRGYVYSSQAISDDAAADEFRRKNPKVPESLRVVKYRSGRYRRLWIDNVVAIGNSGGFVEPLEATALMVVCGECQDLIEVLKQCSLNPTPTMRAFYNKHIAEVWDEIRDFLALHYKLNTRLDTPFWQHCRADTDVSAIQPMLDFYAENGPCGLIRYLAPREPGNFGAEGWLVHLVGNSVPYKARHIVTPEELARWNSYRAENAAIAQQSLDVKQSLNIIRDHRWSWNFRPQTVA